MNLGASFTTILDMNKAWMLALLLCVCVIPPAKTQEQKRQFPWDSGNAFLTLCGDESPKEPYAVQGECLGYVVGVQDGVAIEYDIESRAFHAQGMEPLAETYCSPDEVTQGQMMRILIKFIKDHPETAHFPTKLLAVQSFRDAFPCKSKDKKR